MDGLARIPLSCHRHIWSRLPFSFSYANRTQCSFFDASLSSFTLSAVLNLLCPSLPLLSLTCFGLGHLTWFGISPPAIALGNFKTLSEANLGVAFSEKFIVWPNCDKFYHTETACFHSLSLGLLTWICAKKNIISSKSPSSNRSLWFIGSLTPPLLYFSLPVLLRYNWRT